MMQDTGYMMQVPLSDEMVTCHCEEVKNRRSNLITFKKRDCQAPSGRSA